MSIGDLGWEVKNDIRGQDKHGLRKSIAKIKNIYPGVLHCKPMFSG